MVAVHMIIVGCGRVGAELALSLDATPHSVVVIDRDPDAFRRLPDDWGGQRVVGLGFDRDVLHEADVEHAGALAAVTSGDNTNILAARVAREHFEVPNVVARIYDPRRALLYQRLGIPTVATVTWTVDQVQRRLLPAESAADWADPNGQIMLIERTLPGHWVGRDLGELEVAERCRLTSISRSGQARIARPGLVGQEGDLVHLMVRSDAVTDVDDLLGSGR
jgi:trk system potassium uptake protein TrkA